MPTTNPERLGELSKLYLIIDNNYDLSALDSAILIDAAWEEYCVISLTLNEAVALRQVKDRCTGARTKSSYGRSEATLSFSLNQFRLTEAQKIALDAVISGKQIVSALVLTDAIDNDETFGIVGNFIIESRDQEQPEEGNNTEAYSLKESALSDGDMRPIYGSAYDGT